MTRWGVIALLLAGLLAAAFWVGHRRGWDVRDAAATAEMAALTARLNQAYVDAQVRVHQADLETAGITLDIRLEMKALDIQAPATARESERVIDQTPGLADCSLPDDLRRLRRQQADHSARIAAQAPGAGG